jgi:LysR family transcriptional regulator, transcriptional activator for dmlA
MLFSAADEKVSLRTSIFSAALKMTAGVVASWPVELSEMRLFVQAVRSGSLSAAGRVLGLSPAVASKRLSRLEAGLGVRLLQRSSRRQSLTREGAILLERCSAILADIDAAEAVVSAGRDEARGLLRVSAPVALGRRWIGPAAERFAARHPAVAVHLSLSDAVIDLIEAGFDLAVRIGELPDSRLVSRRLAGNRRVVCGAPAYLRRRGRPRAPGDLRDHDCLLLTRQPESPAEWSFEADGERLAIDLRGRLSSDNGEQVHAWALAGRGLQRRSIWDVADDLAAGRLVEVLARYTSRAAPIHAVYPSRRMLPGKTRLFIDSLTATFAQAEAPAQRPSRRRHRAST